MELFILKKKKAVGLMNVLEKQRVVCLMPDPRRKVSAQ